MASLPNDESGILFNLGLKIVGFFLSFVGGIITTTWVLATKWKGLDDKVKEMEKDRKELSDKLDAMNHKLDKVHERIDNALISRN
jgi:hypothetical protein